MTIKAKLKLMAEMKKLNDARLRAFLQAKKQR